MDRRVVAVVVAGIAILLIVLGTHVHLASTSTAVSGAATPTGVVNGPANVSYTRATNQLWIQPNNQQLETKLFVGTPMFTTKHGKRVDVTFANGALLRLTPSVAAVYASGIGSETLPACKKTKTLPCQLTGTSAQGSHKGIAIAIADTHNILSALDALPYGDAIVSFKHPVLTVTLRQLNVPARTFKIKRGFSTQSSVFLIAEEDKRIAAIHIWGSTVQISVNESKWDRNTSLVTNCSANDGSAMTPCHTSSSLFGPSIMLTTDTSISDVFASLQLKFPVASTWVVHAMRYTKNTGDLHFTSKLVLILANAVKIGVAVVDKVNTTTSTNYIVRVGGLTAFTLQKNNPSAQTVTLSPSVVNEFGITLASSVDAVVQVPELSPWLQAEQRRSDATSTLDGVECNTSISIKSGSNYTAMGQSCASFTDAGSCGAAQDCEFGETCQQKPACGTFHHTSYNSGQ